MERILTAIARKTAAAVAGPGRRGGRLRSLRGAAPLAAMAAVLAAAPAAAAPLAPQAAITAPDGPGGQFGASLALSADGSTALVGAPFDQSRGRITFYARSGGEWVQQGPSLAGLGAAGSCTPEEAGEAEPCRFGYAAALSADGSTAVVGAPRSRGNKGTAFVFERTGSTWALAATLQPAEAARFGRAVALSANGDEALIGGPGDGRGAAAWLFKREGTAWTQDGAKLTGSEAGEQFGFSVALSGDGETALIGAPGGEEHEGGAWAYARTEGAWARGGKLEPAGLTEGQQFGRSVALSANGSTALIGAPGALGRAGEAFVFVRSGPGWSAQGPPLGSEEGLVASRLGTALALGGSGGDIALLGAPGYEERRGEIREFGRSGTHWVPLGASWLGEGAEHARFGSTVALSADAATALVGAPFYEQEAGGVWSLAEPFTEPPPVEPPPTETGGSGEENGPQHPPEPQAKSGLAVLGTISESPPAPVQDATGNIAPSGGSVLVKLPGSGKFVPLTGVLHVPFGTIVDASHGSATVTTVGPAGKLQTITFSSGVFKLVSRGHGRVAAVLSGGNFGICPARKHHGRKASAASTQSSRKHTVRKLWASGHGSYTTQGNYAAGAVQGTKWLTEDKCDGTLIVVLTDKVLVTNLVTHRKKLVKAHHSYFAPAP